MLHLVKVFPVLQLFKIRLRR